MPFMAGCLVIVDYAFQFIFLIATFFSFAPIIKLKRLDFAKILLFYSIFFVISDYFMVLTKEKLLTFAGVILAYVIVFGCYYFKPNSLSTISYISQYNSSSIVLKSKSGQVVVVGCNNLIDDFANATKETFDVFIANGNVTQANYHMLEEMGFKQFISFEEGKYSENDVLQLGKDYIVGEFKLTYLAFGEDMVGIRINFDNYEIFIASEEKLSYNEFDLINEKYAFDFVFANYSLKEGDFVHISTKSVDGCDYSFNEIGNMAFDGRMLRRLD